MTTTDPTPFHKLNDPLKEIVDPNTNKNVAHILCPINTCRCVIIRKGAATLVERVDNKLALPEHVLQGSTEQLDDENAEGRTYFWHLGNMMDFENVGFSKTVDTTKYLSCADCDAGPIGYHDTQSDPKEFLVNVRRARYQF
ncbi:Mss4-like protein [Lichtheimia hyalospora FSU 10163]|nr:Mss4-like protein [Lichtheimia hyalospora FSU 10163]